MVTKEIKIDQLKFDPEVLARSSVNIDYVVQYAEDLENGANFPAVDVMDDGENLYLYDGNLRVNAHLKCEKTTIMANVHEGTRRDGILLSCKANTKHGKRRSGGEAKEMIIRLLQDEEWQQWGATLIAEKCGSSRQYVNQVKRDVSTGNSFQFPTTTKGKDGKIRNTENIGKNQGPSDEELKQEELNQEKLKEQAEELKKQKEELRKKEELSKQEEVKKEAELKKKAEELKKKEDKLEQEKLKKLKQEKFEQEKLKRKEDFKKKEELRKKEELKKKEDDLKKQKEDFEKEKLEQEKLKKQAELKKQEELKEQKGAKKQVKLGAKAITSDVKAQADINILKQQVQNLEGVVIDKDKRIFILEKQTDDYQSLIAELKIEIDKLESEKEALDMVNENLQEELDQLQPETV